MRELCLFFYPKDVSKIKALIAVLNLRGSEARSGSAGETEILLAKFLVEVTGVGCPI